MKDHTPLLDMLIVVFLSVLAIVPAKPYNNSVSRRVRMPLLSNELKAPFVADLDVSALNAQLKDYIDENIVSTFTEKIEDVVNKTLLELKNGMLNEYSSKMETSNIRHEQRLSEMHTEYEKRFSNLSEKQRANATKFMENVQKWQNTMMLSTIEQSGYFQKSNIKYENHVSEILRNYSNQISQISKEAITNFTDLKTDMKEWKREMAADLIKSVHSNLTQFQTHMIHDIDMLKGKVERIQEIIPAHECSDIPKVAAGVYDISPDDSHTFKVRCTPNGWTAIQWRFQGATNFYRNWQDYENGFGDLSKEFWLGNKKIALLTSQGNHKLMIILSGYHGSSRVAQFKNFKVGNQSTNYRLTVSGYHGNAGDSMTYHNNMPFSTYDRDNDRSSTNCASTSTLQGAWWYNSCYRSSLNGKYSKSSLTGQIKYLSAKRTGSFKGSAMLIKRT